MSNTVNIYEIWNAIGVLTPIVLVIGLSLFLAFADVEALAEKFFPGVFDSKVK